MKHFQTILNGIKAFIKEHIINLDPIDGEF
jgi:hypothetical protein